MNRIACGQLALLDDQTEPLRFDAEESARRRDTGQARALETAGSEWRARALAVVRYVALWHTEFTSDAVREEADRRGLETPNRYAWGGCMSTAAKAGICRRTNRTAPSRRVAAHAHANNVWESLIHGATVGSAGQ